MDTWILVADEVHATLLVQSSVGSLHEIESWDCPQAQQRFSYASDIARRIESLQTDFDSLVVAAPSSLLQDLSIAFGDTLNARIAAELAQNLTHLSSRELRTQLEELIPA
ncbi:host attachment protein [bacterium]|nr:host attachment protein [bacterium]